MRCLLLILLSVFYSFFSLAQKKLIQFSTPSTWPLLKGEAISNDGNYVTYIVGSPSVADTLIIQATDRLWQMKLTGILSSFFTENSQQLIFTKSDDSLGIFDLRENKIKYLDKVTDFKIPKEGNGKWLAYMRREPRNELMLLNLIANETKALENVDGYDFSDNGSTIWVQKKSVENIVGSENDLLWLKLETGELDTLCRNCQAIDPVFDAVGETLAFLTNRADRRNDEIELRYYKSGMDSSIVLIDSATDGMEGFSITKEGHIILSKKGDKVFFKVEKKNHIEKIASSANVKVHIDNYRQAFFQFEKDRKVGQYTVVVYLNGRRPKVIRIKQGEGLPYMDSANDEDQLVDLKDTLESEKGQLRISRHKDIYIISTQDGSKTLIGKGIVFDNLSFSLKGKYLVWYDMVRKNWFAYNMPSGRKINITSKIYMSLESENDYPGLFSSAPYKLIGWLDNDEAVLIQDRYDIWEVDPEGVKPPVNLTGAYGRRTHTILSYLDFDKFHVEPFHWGDTLLFSAFCPMAKTNGFFQLVLNHQSRLEKLVMEPKVFYGTFLKTPNVGAAQALFPIKARSTSKYLITCMNETEYPNLYISSDLKEFQPLTQLEPQRQFNWFRSELHHFSTQDGKRLEGVLYKPENFDPKKKYPIIFYFYEKNANSLHLFIHPTLSVGAITIPWFVSNGYLVFVPDIVYPVAGYPGQDAYNSVVSAANYLSKMPWVDAKHMGLQGHSHGGFETNYIISHTSLFAAAAPSAASSDLISEYLIYDGQDYYERGQGRIGYTLWERPGLYIENSSIFNADKVSTPVLIMHNPEDGSVPFNQGREWFTALSRLGKKAWMLSYEGEGHNIWNEKDQMDYSIRLAQFFNYYLKDEAPPKWMTQGGELAPDLDDYSLDYSGSRP